jgi:hypothetical protein
MLNIKEINNNKLQILPIKMKNDGIIKGVADPLPNNFGFFMMIIGRPNSGKATFLLNLITKQAKTGYYKKFDRVFIFSNSLKTITTKIKLPEDRLFNGISELEIVLDSIKDDDDRTMIILDDCITDIKNHDYILKMIYNRRHISGSLSICLTSQNFNKIPLAIRKACTDLVFFQTGNKKEIEAVFDDLINIEKKYFDDIIRYCFSKSSHEFLFYKTETGNFYHGFNFLKLEYE